METTKTNIPTGTSKEDNRERTSIIKGFYMEFLNGKQERLVYNQQLKTEILVNKDSMYETARHASKRYLSTLAVLQLESVVALAKKVGKPLDVEPGNKNQAKFRKMIKMSHELPGIGKVKLMVGILKGGNKKGKKNQYSITAIEG